mgnify:CR=1 FL=1
MPSKLGFGNTRKKSSAMPMYGKSQKNPVMMLGDLDKDGKMSGYESKRQAAIEENTKKAAPKMYDKKSPAKKYAPGQAAAIYAQKADDAKKKKNK